MPQTRARNAFASAPCNLIKLIALSSYGNLFPERRRRMPVPCNFALFRHQMPQLVCFGLEITLVFQIFPDVQGNPFDHVNPRIFQGLDFSGLLVNSLTERMPRYS